MGEEKLQALFQESLAVATRTEAMKRSDLARVVVDTTVQPKAVTFPTDAKLLNRARERLVRLAKKHGVELRQSYARVGKRALIKHQRYAHAHQFRRANKALRKLKTYLGRIIRDIVRKIAGNDGWEEIFAWPLSLARRVLHQDRHQRGPKVYSLHAPEVECIGKGKAHKPYEFGVKVSVATPVKRSHGGQFVATSQHCLAIHTTATPSPRSSPTSRRSSATPSSASSPMPGYRGHNAPPEYKFRVYTSGQKRRLTAAQVAEVLAAQNPDRPLGHRSAQIGLRPTFFTDDALRARILPTLSAGSGVAAASHHPEDRQHQHHLGGECGNEG